MEEDVFVYIKVKYFFFNKVKVEILELLIGEMVLEKVVFWKFCEWVQFRFGCLLLVGLEEEFLYLVISMVGEGLWILLDSLEIVRLEEGF